MPQTAIDVIQSYLNNLANLSYASTGPTGIFPADTNAILPQLYPFIIGDYLVYLTQPGDHAVINFMTIGGGVQQYTPSIGGTFLDITGNPILLVAVTPNYLYYRYPSEDSTLILYRWSPLSGQEFVGTYPSPSYLVKATGFYYMSGAILPLLNTGNDGTELICEYQGEVMSIQHTSAWACAGTNFATDVNNNVYNLLDMRILEQCPSAEKNNSGLVASPCGGSNNNYMGIQITQELAGVLYLSQGYPHTPVIDCFFTNSPATPSGPLMADIQPLDYSEGEVTASGIGLNTGVVLLMMPPTVPDFLGGPSTTQAAYLYNDQFIVSNGTVPEFNFMGTSTDNKYYYYNYVGPDNDLNVFGRIAVPEVPAVMQPLPQLTAMRNYCHNYSVPVPVNAGGKNLILPATYNAKIGGLKP